MKKLLFAGLLAFALSSCTKDPESIMQAFGSVEYYNYGSCYFRLHDGRWIKPTNITLTPGTDFGRQYGLATFTIEDETGENNIYPATFYEALGVLTKQPVYSAAGLTDDPIVMINEFDGTEKILCYNNFIDIRYTYRTISGKKPTLDLVCNNIDQTKHEIDMRLYFNADGITSDAPAATETAGIVAFDIKDLSQTNISPIDQKWTINLTVKMYDGTTSQTTEKVYHISYNPGKLFADVVDY